MIATATDTVLNKGLPVNLDAERFVLGSILLDDSLYVQAAGALQPDDFALEKHRRIFARMSELQERGSASTASRLPMNSSGMTNSKRRWTELSHLA